MSVARRTRKGARAAARRLLPSPPPHPLPAHTRSELLKSSRPSIAMAYGGSGSAAPLLLGQADATFTFAADAPVPTSWCGCAAVAADAGAAVRGFIEERLAGK